MSHISQLLEVIRAYREYVDALLKGLALPEMPGFDRDWADTVEAKAKALGQPAQVGTDHIDFEKAYGDVYADQKKQLTAALAQPAECPNLKNCEGQCFQCEYYNAETGQMEYPVAQPEPVAPKFLPPALHEGVAEHTKGTFTVQVSGLTIRQIKEVFEDKYHGSMMWSGGAAYPDCETSIKFVRVAQPEPVSLTNEQIRKLWASENGLEDMDMCKLDDFTTVVRAVLAAAAKGGV